MIGWLVTFFLPTNGGIIQGENQGMGGEIIRADQPKIKTPLDGRYSTAGPKIDVKVGDSWLTFLFFPDCLALVHVCFVWAQKSPFKKYFPNQSRPRL